MACVVQQKDARQWFAELSVDMDKVGENFVIIKYADCFVTYFIASSTRINVMLSYVQLAIIIIIIIK